MGTGISNCGLFSFTECLEVTLGDRAFIILLDKPINTEHRKYKDGMETVKVKNKTYKICKLPRETWIQ